MLPNHPGVRETITAQQDVIHPITIGAMEHAHIRVLIALIHTKDMSRGLPFRTDTMDALTFALDGVDRFVM